MRGMHACPLCLACPGITTVSASSLIVCDEYNASDMKAFTGPWYELMAQALESSSRQYSYKCPHQRTPAPHFLYSSVTFGPQRWHSDIQHMAQQLWHARQSGNDPGEPAQRPHSGVIIVIDGQRHQGYPLCIPYYTCKCKCK